jgi:hypothetical protein
VTSDQAATALELQPESKESWMKIKKFDVRKFEAEKFFVPS